MPADPDPSSHRWARRRNFCVPDASNWSRTAAPTVGKLVLGNDPDEYMQELKVYDEAGHTHAYLHQIGPEQEGSLKIAKSELLPRL